MLCDPTDREEVENAAMPVLSNVAVPSVVGGLVSVSLNCTVPVGTIDPEDGITVAVNVTELPTVDGFSEDVIVVVEPTTANAESPIGTISEHDSRIQTNGALDIFIRLFSCDIAYNQRAEFISKNKT